MDRGASPSAQDKRVAGWLQRHPGASDPASKNYDPLWRQKSRGHKAHEHVTRRERTVAAGGVPSGEREFIKRLAKRQATRAGRDQASVVVELTGLRSRLGMGKVKELSALVNGYNREVHGDTRRRIRRRAKVGDKIVRFEMPAPGRSERRAKMEALAAEWGIDWRLLFYG